ncbi:helix-turn-helix domain-containing protein [Marinobacterium sedimentorum]|uniref:AraC-like ligand-binding domain-containing protein n=1 Tax=Marinobacterium sedimentorum TaxID=2927804 RepID=UPI0020C629F7|nr:helix-turn-helix domain-containing protein [Marinobacterium sedimentorum]MCP8687176.1 helix-turn-helix domain-containing protein [Marinobacterium sedimentorum]
MHKSYNTSLIPRAERAGYWREVIDKTYFPLTLDFREPEAFSGSLSCWNVEQISISRLETSATRYRRNARNISKEEDSPFLITIPQLQPVDFSQDRHKVICNPGSFILERSDLPYEFSYARDNQLWVLRVPDANLRTRVRTPERFLYMEFSLLQGAGALFSDFLASLVRQVPYLGTQGAGLASQQLLELLALTLEDDDRVIASGEACVSNAHLMRIEHFVRENITNPDLSPELIASACQISTRYMHKLFQGSGQTVGQWIKEVRLQAAMNDIRSGSSKVTLAEVAYRWGFADQAHFCRSFKSRFGCTAREARESAREDL